MPEEKSSKQQSEQTKKVLQALKRYPEIIRVYEKSEPSCAAFLSDAQGYFDGEKTVIRLKNGFHLKMLENKNAQDTLQVIIRNIEGIDAKVVFELSEGKSEMKSDLSDLTDE